MPRIIGRRLRVCVDLYNSVARTFLLSLPDIFWRPPGTEVPISFGRLVEKLESRPWCVDEDMMTEDRSHIPEPELGMPSHDKSVANISDQMKLTHHARRWPSYVR